MSKLSKTIGAIFYQWLPESGCEAGGDAETPAFLERYNEEFNPWKCGSRSNLEGDPGAAAAKGRVACQARWRRVKPALKCTFP